MSVKVEQQEITPDQVIYLLVDVLMRTGYSDEDIVDLLNNYGINAKQI